MRRGERQIEMLWDCAICGRTNGGRYLNCTSCGKAKSTERYYMPSNTGSAPSITDPDLLRVARSGPNWSCGYCSSDQRRPDGNCANCGAGQAQVPPAARMRRSEPTHFDPAVFPSTPWNRHPLTWIGGILLFFAAIFAWCNRTREYEARVVSVEWTQSIVVDRYAVVTHEDWKRDVPSEAFGVEDLGQRIDHYDSVLDGYRTESYTESVACGQDCTPVPEICSESCSANGNGFATCRTTCSGGGQSCSTRYCTEWRTRQVPTYHEEPRYDAYARYKIWEWDHNRTVDAHGQTTTDLYWPVDKARVGEDLAPGEKERGQRSGKYVVRLSYDRGEQISVAVSDETFSSCEAETIHVLTIKGSTVKLDGIEVEEIEE